MSARVISLSLLLGSLSACGPGQLLSPSIVNTQVIYPNLPDLPAPAEIPPKPVQFIFPKDTVDFIGMDYANWSNLAYNIDLFKQREQQWQVLLTQVNKERADWRTKNAAQIDKSINDAAAIKASSSVATTPAKTTGGK